MCAIRLSGLQFSLLIALLLGPGIVNGQLTKIDSLLQNLPIIDSSDYIPSYYEGALDYNLMIAASKGYVSEIESLISRGADVNSETNEGATPLVFAVSNNWFAAVKTLIKYNPDLDKVTTGYETPLLMAVKNRSFDIAEILIRAGADMELTDRHGATPLHHASLNGYLDIVDLLLYYGAPIDEKTIEGTTPLLASIWAGYTDVSDLLIQNGANMEARDNDGFTPFLMAAFLCDTLMMDILYKKGVDIYAVNNTRHNALTLSILGGQKHATSYLLRTGNKWTENKGDAVSPYSMISKYRRKEMVDILKKNNIPGQLKYEIDQVSVSASTRFWINDIYTGISFSFKEPYLNAGFFAGCDFKLWYTRVLVRKSETLFYQYFDKGSVAYAGLFKDFALTDYLVKYNFVLSTSLLAGYSFGNELKGTLLAPENKFMVIPSVSLKITKMNFTLSTGAEYMRTGFYRNGPIWIRIGCSYNHFFDKVRTMVKPLKWY